MSTSETIAAGGLAIICVFVAFVSLYNLRLAFYAAANRKFTESPIFLVLPVFCYLGAILLRSDYVQLDISPWLFLFPVLVNVLFVTVVIIFSRLDKSNAT
jgi:hypothetical protein